MAARIHHQLVLIHPFENGNGRFSRLVADRFLLSFRCSYPLWPNHMNVEGFIRQDYINTLKRADNHDFSLLIEFMKKFGARDPSIFDLFHNKFYRNFLSGSRGVALMNAFLAAYPIEAPNGVSFIELARKAKLEEIADVLSLKGIT